MTTVETDIDPRPSTASLEEWAEIGELDDRGLLHEETGTRVPLQDPERHRGMIRVIARDDDQGVRIQGEGVEDRIEGVGHNVYTAPDLRVELPDQLGTIIERSEEHTSELQSRGHLVCRLLLEKKKKKKSQYYT